MRAITTLTSILLTLTLGLAACGGEETNPEETHTPASAKVFIGDTDGTDDLLLEAGETVRVEVKFYDDEGDEITGIEGEHFTALVFTPTGLATTADVADHHFQKDVTAQGDLGTGTYTIGYGHDESADELTFGPYDARVVATGGAQR